MNATLTSLSGAELRALASNGDTAAQGEIARRKAKVDAKLASGEKVTVASLSANGYREQADQRIAHAQAGAKPAKASKSKVADKPQAAFTRTTDLVTTKKSRSTVASLSGRMDVVESAVIELAKVASTQNALLDRLTSILTAKVV